MRIDDDDRREGDNVRPPPSGAALLLSELQHRVSNEVAACVAALQLVKSVGALGPRMTFLEQALERLEGFGNVHRVLSANPGRRTDVSEHLHRLCRGLVAGRPGLERASIRLLLPSTVIDGAVAQGLLLIASELVFNAVRHALVGREGEVTVRLTSCEREVSLLVSDDGPGMRAAASTSGTGLGSGIVASLVGAAGGRLECDTDASGTAIRVYLPLHEAADDPF